MSDVEPSRDSIASNFNQNTEEVSNADLLSLFKTYMNDKLAGIERTFDDKTHSLAKKVKKVESTFKFKGNQIQFELNADITDNLERAIQYIGQKRPERGLALLEDSVNLLKKRNKLIRIADESEGGWNTVQEYLSDDVASDSEDEKRIRAAENRACRKIKSAKLEKKQPRKRTAEASGSSGQIAHNGGNVIPTISSQQPFRGSQGQSGPVGQPKPADICFSCGIQGHWARNCRVKNNKGGFSFSRGNAV